MINRQTLEIACYIVGGYLFVFALGALTNPYSHDTTEEFIALISLFISSVSIIVAGYMLRTGKQNYAEGLAITSAVFGWFCFLGLLFSDFNYLIEHYWVILFVAIIWSLPQTLVALYTLIIDKIETNTGIASLFITMALVDWIFVRFPTIGWIFYDSACVFVLWLVILFLTPFPILLAGISVKTNKFEIYKFTIILYFILILLLFLLPSHYVDYQWEWHQFDMRYAFHDVVLTVIILESIIATPIFLYIYSKREIVFTESVTRPTIKKTTKSIVEPELQPVIPHIHRLIESQSKPMEHLNDFYSYLEIQGFNLTPELKEKIRLIIQEMLEEKRRAEKKAELEARLFGQTTPSSTTISDAPKVIPQPTVPPNSKCQVCLTEFSSAEPGAVKCPHCGSLFHYRCIVKWVNKNGVCPICKKEVSV